MRRRATLFATALLAGCAGSAGTPSALQPQVTGDLTSLRRTLIPLSESCRAKTCVYVAARTDNSGPRRLDEVVAYAADANGNVPPIQTIKGKKARLDLPLGIAVDAGRNIYITNGYSGNVTVYAAGANGNVAPIETVSGSVTGLAYPLGIAVDAARNIYVVNAANYLSATVTVYAAGADGNVPPIQTITGSNTGLNDPRSIAVDAGRNMYVANSQGNSVTVYSADANGNVAPIRTIIGKKTRLNYPYYPDGIAVR